MHNDSLPGRRAVFQHCSGKTQHRRTSVLLLASSVSSTTGPFNDTRGNADALCTFIHTCSVGSSGSTHPTHGKSKKAEKAEEQAVSGTAPGNNASQALENPFPVPIPCTVCLLLAPNTTCSPSEELLLLTSSPSLHKKPFFLQVPFLEDVRRELAHLTMSAEGSMISSSRNCSFLSLKS